MKTSINIIPLGGTREQGENLYAVEIDGGIYVLDCGLKYPKNTMIGINTIIPDFSYLRKNQQRIVGVFLTSASLASLGALPYFLREFKVPVFGAKLTIARAKNLVHRYNPTRDFNKFNVINDDSEIIFNDITVTFFKTTTPMPDSMGIVLDTKAGEIVYTGNYKFDQTVPASYQTDLTALSQIQQKGALALLGNSNDAEDPHPHTPEQDIAKYIYQLFKSTKHRIIVGCLEDHLLRLQQIFQAADLTHRRVCIINRHQKTLLNSAIRLHRIQLPKHPVLVNPHNLKKLKPEQTILLYVGQMGEPIKAIQNMTNFQTHGMHLQPNDLVFVASLPDASLETRVAQTKDMVSRAHGKYVILQDKLNATQEANQNDLRLMLNLIKPQYLIPVAGEYRMLTAYQRLANEVGFSKNRVILSKKGSVIEYQKGHLRVKKPVTAGDIIIDGSGIGDVGTIVLRDRQVLSQDGIFLAAVTIDHKAKRVLDDPVISTRGFINTQTHPKVIQGCKELIERIVQDDLNHDDFDWSRLKQDVRDGVSSYLYEKTSHHPVIMPIIMEVNQNHSKN